MRNTIPDPKNAVCRVAEAPVATSQIHEDFYQNFPEAWIDVTEEARQDYLLSTHVAKILSPKTYALDKTMEQAIATAPTVVTQAALAIKDIDTELHEHAHTVHGITDMLLAQLREVNVLAKSWWHKNPSIMIFFLTNYDKQKKDLLFNNKNGILCVKYPLSNVLYTNVRARS